MKRAPKFGPRYGMKRFEEGGKIPGMTSYADSGSAGGSNISFKDAFKAARKQGLATFPWRGKTYTTELKEDKKPKEKTSPRQMSSDEFGANVNARLGSEDKILSDSFKSKSTRDESSDFKERPKAAKTDKDTAREMYSGLSKYRNSESVFENLAKGRKPGYRATPGYKKGGSVGSVSKRADGCASKGKTRGRFV